MVRIPLLRRRRSRTDQVLDLLKGAAKTWTSIKVGSAAARAAKGGAKAYGAAKTAKVAGRPALGVLAVPAVGAAGGVLLWRKLASSSSSNGATPADPSGALTDPPAGASNPPVGPSPNFASETT
jgi:hypothetical protein